MNNPASSDRRPAHGSVGASGALSGAPAGHRDDGRVVAIDLGTGGPKVGVVSESGCVEGSASERVGLHLLADGGAEQDPAEWWNAITRATRRAMEVSGTDPGDVVAVSCTGQWSGTVAVDGAGSPLRPAVIWMDSRGSKAMRRQSAGNVNVLGYDVRKVQRWIRLTGGAPGHSGKDPTAHILWIREAEPDVYRSTYKFLEPVDWVNQRLTGRFAASFDSIAVHWVTDNRRIYGVDYDSGLLQMSGLERAKLPDLVPTGAIVGGVSEQAARDLGLVPGTPVCAASGDLHSAAVGSGAVGDFEAHLYIGTSSWISCHVPFKRTSVTSNIASIPSALPGRYVVADEHETAGACLTFLASTLFESDARDRGGGHSDEVDRREAAENDGSDVYRRMDAMAEREEVGSGRLLFTPWLNGERSPVDDHTVRAGFHNLSLATTRSQMVRATYEGVAFNSRWLLDAVERFVKRPFSSLVFIGGGANSEVWSQIHADVTGRPIKQAAEPVLANVRGAAFLALLALGRIRTEDIPAMVPVESTFEPDATNAGVYDELFAEFVNLYKQNKKIYRRLNRSL